MSDIRLLDKNSGQWLIVDACNTGELGELSEVEYRGPRLNNLRLIELREKKAVWELNDISVGSEFNDELKRKKQQNAEAKLILPKAENFLRELVQQMQKISEEQGQEASQSCETSPEISEAKTLRDNDLAATGSSEFSEYLFIIETPERTRQDGARTLEYKGKIVIYRENQEILSITPKYGQLDLHAQAMEATIAHLQQKAIRTANESLASLDIFQTNPNALPQHP